MATQTTKLTYDVVGNDDVVVTISLEMLDVTCSVCVQFLERPKHPLPAAPSVDDRHGRLIAIRASAGNCKEKLKIAQLYFGNRG